MKEFKASGGGAETSKEPTKKAPKKPSTSKKVSTPVKSNSIVSKEFIESEDDSSMSEDDSKSKAKTMSKKVFKFFHCNNSLSLKPCYLTCIVSE